MKYLLLSLLLSSCYFLSGAQWTTAEKEINDQIWRPFIETYNSLDSEGFIAIHTDDVIRVSRDGHDIKLGPEYAESIKNGNKRNIERKRTRVIAFSFLERIIEENTAYEVGYYKVISSSPEQEPLTFIGKFHVVLRKVDGVWKIAVDSDSSAENSYTEENFRTGREFK